MNILFLVGGGVSSIQTTFLQNKRDISVMESALAHKVTNKILGQTVINSIKSKIMPRCCGSSGAVLTLMGFNEVLRVNSIIHLFKNYAYNKNARYEFVDLLLGFLGSVIYIGNEWTLMRSGGMDSGHLINHAAHIQGFIFGASVAILYTVRRKYMKVSDGGSDSYLLKKLIFF